MKDNSLVYLEYIEAKVKEIMAELLDSSHDEQNLNASFVDLAISSVEAVELVEAINEKLGTGLGVEVVFDYRDVKELTTFIFQRYRNEFLSKELPLLTSEVQLSEEGNISTASITPVLKEESTNDYKAYRDETASSEQEAIPPTYPCSPYPERHSSDIAIIGISGRFAGSANLEAFWDHLQAGESCIEPIRRAGWEACTNSDPAPYHMDTSLCKWGGMLENIDQFDPLFFHISPLEAARMEPQQRLFLEEAYKSFEDAGYSAEQLSDKKVGVFVGARPSDYKEQALRGESARLLSECSSEERDAHLFLGNDMAILAARISYFLNLKGPSLTLDTASSSSLVAIHLACESIRTGESEMALAGGVFVMSSPEYAVMAAKTQMLSPDGKCRTFDKSANGIVLGEGVGVLVLKPLEVALEDRDHIHGVILGSAMNQDGKTFGMTAPSMLAQKALLVSLYKKVAIHPETVSYIEAHGTGSKLGDPVEVQALTEAFRVFTDKTQFCTIGSHKPNVGHTIMAAGMAGVFKILLAMKYQQIPPTINVEEVNPQIDFQGSPFFINTELPCAWKSCDSGPRRAGVSSFGLSGTNCHVILEEPPPNKKMAQKPTRPYAFFPFSAKTKETLKQKVEDMVKWLEKEGEKYSVEDISYTLVQGRSHFSVRSAVVARDTNDLLQSLRAIMSQGGSVHGVEQGKGYGSEQTEPLLHQYGNWLLRELLESALLDQKEYKEKFESLADLYVKGYRLDWGQLFKKGRYYRVPLPTYPFSGESYWIAEDGTHLSSRDQNTRLLRSYAGALSGVADLEHESGQEPRSVPTDRLREALSQMVSRLLKVRVEEIDAETHFSEYGFDSITFTEFANRLNQTYQLDLTPAHFFEYSTLERLTQYLYTTYATVLVPHFVATSPHQQVTPVAFGTSPRVTDKVSPVKIPQRHTRIGHSSVPFTSAQAEPIAIIGMSGVFPQTPDVQSLWSNLLEDKNCIGEIPASRWYWQAYFGDPASETNKTNVKWAGVVEDIELFDPLFFGISGAEAEQMDPQQRLLMMYVWKAIEDAGYTASSLSGTNTALFVGTTSSGYSERVSRAGLAVEGYSSTGLAPSVGPNRMSYFLNLHGPSEAIDTACSSSLVAIHRGVSAIESDQCTMAIVGGVNTLVSPELHISYSKAGMLCEDGRCKTFSANANGYVRGEGVGMLVLKKLVEAEQAGDHIYGVIRGSAENHGGRASSLTAPNPRAQADLLIAAYRKAGVDPRTVGYIEAHGTGTPLGDPIEINGLKTAFSELAQIVGEGPMPQASCGIGSVKSNIGHLELASGVAGVIKVLLQLQHKKLVKSLHCEQLNPHIQLEGSPFYIVQEPRDWEALQDRAGNTLPRRAGVSSFGFGGANAHVVLEEYVPESVALSPRSDASPGAIIVLSARNEERLHEQVRQLLTWLGTGTYTEDMLADLAYTLQVGREAMEERLALQVSSLAELEEKLHRYLRRPQEGGSWYRGQVKRYSAIDVFATDEDGQRAIAAWMSKGKYGKLLDLWVKGGTIDWKHLYEEDLPSRISLPTYPFARERYWIPSVVHPNGLSIGELLENFDQIRTMLLTPSWKEEAITSVHLEDQTPLSTELLVLLCDLPDIEAACIQAQMPSGGRCRSLQSSQARRELRFQDAVVQLIQELEYLLQSRPTDVGLVSTVSFLVQVVVTYREEPSLLEALAGVLKTTQQEYPKLRGQLIEVEGEPEEGELLARLHENQFRPHELRIRYRDGKRWVREWLECAEVSAQRSLPWKEGGCYLISGGAGGLARLFVQEIARQVRKATVILVGRSPLLGEQQVQLEKSGDRNIHVDYQQVDVSDGPAVHTLIQRILEQYRHLNGIIHAAGVLRDSLLLNKTPEDVLAVLSPKVIGVEHLDEASSELPLDFFVLCSSLSAITGNVGQADYASANAYLDAFAHARQAQVRAGERHGATVSINWPYWEAGGMRMDESKIQVMRDLLGEVPMGMELGIKTLYQALASGFAQVVVLHGQVERIKELLPGRLGEPPVGAAPVESATGPGGEDAHSSDTVSLDHLREALLQMVSRFLNVRVEEIDAETPLSEYGFDSITFTTFAVHLNQTYKLDLTPPLFYEYSTLERLARYLQTAYSSVLAPHFARVSPVAPGLARKDFAPASVRTEERSSVVPRQRSRLARVLVDRSEQAVAPPIAIIGMSGAFPQAPDVQSLWSNLLAGRDCISEIPPSRWDWQTYFGHTAAREANKTNIKWAGVLEGIELFDPLFFGISPREAEQMDPQQRLLMLSVWKAIEDAGYSAESLSGTNTALFVGTTSTGYSERISRANMEIEGYSSTGLTPSVGPGRMSYFLNLHGPSEAIDTACSSSLVAIHRGINVIESGQCDMALVGGVNTLVSPEMHISLSKAGMLCEDGRCKTFSAQADGYVRGEGVGILVLKRLDLAERDGDYIYGVIRGSAENHGGRASSLTAPNPRAQADLLIAAYRKAGIDPRTVSYIEAHGTGTALGDPIEINGLKTAFDELAQIIGEGPMPEASCGIGSVKSNIGHLELAAGVAGVIKVLLQLQYKQLVKSLHCEQINPYIELKASPFYIVQENREWEVLRDREGNLLPRRAGISSFGFGGVNAHVVLEEYVPKPQASWKPYSAQVSGREQAPPLLIVLSARNEEQLHKQVQQLLDWVQAGRCTEESLLNLAYTLQVGREPMEERLALQTSSVSELEKKLQRYLRESQQGGDWYQGQVRQHKEAVALLSIDEELQETIDKWFQRGKYKQLLQWWVKGLRIDWKRLYGEQRPYRISLPTYPFAQEHYWIPIGTNPRATATSSTNTTIPLSACPTGYAPLHPLVQRNTSTLWKQQFSSTFDGDEFFLADHVIKGQCIMPAVAYLEMVFAAVREAIGVDTTLLLSQLRLSSVVWIHPLIVSSHPVTVHIALDAQESGTISFLISEGGQAVPTGEGAEEQICCQGRALVGQDHKLQNPIQGLELSALQSRCQHQIPISECYRRYHSLGINYGPALQGIEKLSRGDGEVLARLRLPVALDAQTRMEGGSGESRKSTHPYVLHPSVLDAALQASIGLLLEQPEIQEPYLPFAFAELSIMSEVPAVGWAWVTRRQWSARVLVVDVEVCDDEGRVAVRMRGLSMRPALSRSFESSRTVLLAPDWKEETIVSARRPEEVPLTAVGKGQAPFLVLLCDLPNIEALRIQAQMPSSGRCHRLHSAHLRRDLHFQDVVVQLIQELQYLLQSRPAEPLGLLLVQVVVAQRGEPSLLEALAGVLKTAQQEYPQLRGQLIEIEGEPEEGQLLTWLAENQERPQDSHIRYRDGKRWVREWQEHPDVTPTTKMPWKEGGCYLISGGAGGLARLFVQEIAQRVQMATVILVGRSPLEASQRLQLDLGQAQDPVPTVLEAGVCIDYQQVDVSDGPAVHALIQRILEQYGHLDGIIHASGVLRDSLLLNKTPEEVLAVLSPKVIGVEHLDEASSELPLDFFVLCSSLSAITGNVGQADYASANAYLDAFAHARQAQVRAGKRHGATASINWPHWEAGGMRMDEPKIQTMRKFLGAEPMGTEAGMMAFYQALVWQQAQVIVLHGQVEHIKRRLQQKPEPDVETAAVIERTSWSTTGEALQAVNPLGEEALQERATAYFKRRLAAVIKVPMQQIEASASLEDYGFDSIMAIRFINVLEDSFGPLPKTLLFEYPTLQSITEHFLHSYYKQLRSVLGIEDAPAIATVQEHLWSKLTGEGQTVLSRRPHHHLALLQKRTVETGMVDTRPDKEAGVGDIAIIGLAGRYPGARDLHEFWENLREGRDCITEIPPERWDHCLYFDADRNKSGTTYSKWGGFLEGVDEFDPLFFNISPREAEKMDPQERLFLECAFATLEDAGYTRKELSRYQGDRLTGNVGVFVGVMYEEYQLFAAQEQIQGRPIVVAGNPSWIANRVSYFCNFHGPSMVVDTMCSSSLSAIHLACQSIRQGDCELALAGGVNVSIHPNKYLLLGQGQFISSQGSCQSFGVGADGYVPGEGVGAVLLKPLAQAEEDRDHIYGVIKATAINHGGKTNGSTVPSPLAQSEVIGQALKRGGIDPRTISYIEAHGTGTQLGDPIEMAGLTRAFQQGMQDMQYCALGSVKSNIGHAESAAGIAGMTKVLLQMRYGQLVPSLHAEVLNPHIDFSITPFVVQRELAEWKRPQIPGVGEGKEVPRRAGISSFGAGGSNAHVILEEYIGSGHWASPESRETYGAGACVPNASGARPVDYGPDGQASLGGGRKRGPALIVLSARTEEQLYERTQQLLSWIQDGRGAEDTQGLDNLTYTLQVGREAMEERLAFQVGSLAELKEKLHRYIERQHEDGDWYRGQVKRHDPIGAFAADEDGHKAVAAWMSKGKYEKLLEWWVKGLTIDWRHLYGERFPHRISLPTYPFACERYWIPTSTIGAGQAQGIVTTAPAPVAATVSVWGEAGDHAMLHPLLQRNISDFFEQRFSSIFDGEEFFLADHVVKGQRIMPGVAYLEMARAAIAQAMRHTTQEEGRILLLTQVVWPRPLVINKLPIEVHIALELQENQEVVFTISSQAHKMEGGTLVHCRGTAKLHLEEEVIESLNLTTIQTRCQHQISGSECYQRYRSLDINYGPAYQGIEQMAVGEGEVLARLRLPAVVAQTRTDFVLHPSMLDAALQACIGLQVELENPHLPFALSELSIRGRVPTRGWAWVHRRQGSTMGSVFDIEVCDDEGHVMVALGGLTTRPLLTEEERRTVLLAPGWKEEANRSEPHSSGLSWQESLPIDQQAKVSMTLVLLCDLPDQFASHLQAQMASDGYCRNLPVRKPTEAIPVSAAPFQQPRRERHFQDVVTQLIQELQHLLRTYPGEAVLVQVVVAQTGESSLLEALGGVLKTAQQEYPRLAGQLIEIEGEPEEGQLLIWLAQNQERLQDLHIRYRDGKRWVRVWQECPEVSAPLSLPWKEGGCYLITGGAGGLGRLFVQEIAQQVEAATIILVGRSPLSREQKRQLEQRGKRDIHIEYRQVDVSDGSEVQTLVQQILEQYGYLNGIIHAAGVLHDSLLLNKTPEDVQTVLSPKVTGVEHLDKASSEICLDFFVLCSSFASVMGNVGQADYAAANAYLDAFAHARTAQVLAGERRGTTLSINWPFWEEGGMQMEAEAIQVMRKRLGLEVMETGVGMRMLYQALLSGLAQVLVAHGQIERIKGQLLRQFPKPLPVESTPNKEQQALTTMEQEVLRERANTHFKKQLAALIKLPMQQIEASAPLSDYGFDSVLAIRLTDALEDIFGPLSKTLLFEYPTIHRLTEYFLYNYPQPLRSLLGSLKDEIEAVAVTTISQSTQEHPSDRASSYRQTVSSNHLRHRPGLLQKGSVGTVHIPTDASIADGHAQQDKAVACDRGQSPTLQAPQGDIAIIGMAGRYPGARDLRQFWENLSQGRDCITEVPASRWDHRLYYDTDKNKPGTTCCKWGGFLEGVDEFDPLFFNISPREAQMMDPQERLFLECVFATLEDAGYTRSWARPRSHDEPEGHSISEDNGSSRNIGVFVGVMYEEYQLFGVEAQSQGRPVALSSTSSSIANRVSYFCDFHGPSLAVNTMCSSSLTAIHLACQSIQQGDCELALAGGVNVSIHPNKYLLLSQGKFVSSSGGHCESFGLGADGYVPGEGVGAVLLKPLAQAEEDRDHIYGVIKATAINHGGKTNGYTVPSPQAQAEVIGQALKKAGIDPRTISYIEAHGTGTVLGDPIEIAGLTRAFQQGTQDKQYCAIGSVKSNIGHAESAAGIAGLTKVLLQMRYGQLVPSLHSKSCNPHIDFSVTPFVVQQELSEWERPQAPGAGPIPRRAGISSFGAGGSNAHVILEEYVEKEQSEPDEDGRNGGTRLVPAQQSRPVLLVLSARTEAQLNERVRQLLAWIQEEECADATLSDLAYTLQVGREAMEERLALQVSSLAELREKLHSYIERKHEDGEWYRGQVKRNDVISIFVADEEGQKAITTWMSKGKYEKVLSLWVRGATIDWKCLYGEQRPQRISLPTYPFARERHWIPATKVELTASRTDIATSSPPIPTVSLSSKKTAPLLIAQMAVETLPSACPVPLVERNENGKASTIEGCPQPIAPSRVALRHLADHTEPSSSSLWACPTGADQPHSSVSQSRTGQSFNSNEVTMEASLPATQGAMANMQADLSVQALEEDLARSLAQALYMEQSAIDVEIPFVDMGLDSVISAEWVQSINKQYASNLAASCVYDYPTILQLASFLKKEGLRHPQMPPSMSTLSLDDVLVEVYQRNLDPNEAEKLLPQMFL